MEIENYSRANFHRRHGECHLWFYDFLIILLRSPKFYDRVNQIKMRQGTRQ